VDGLEVRVTYKPIRHLYLRVRADHVALSAPLRTPEVRLREAVVQRRGWIRAHQAALRSAEAARGEAVARGEVPLWGRPTPVVDGGTGRWAVREDPAGLVVIAPASASPESRRAALDRWLARQVADRLDDLLPAWEARMGLRATGYRLRAMTSRWGSCSRRTGRLTFNTRLVGYDPAVLEYVVVHELAHLAQAGHGPGFQALMSRHLPDWRARRAQLRR